MSFVEDFEAIARALKERQAEQKPPIITEDNPNEYQEAPSQSYWTDKHGYVESFQALAITGFDQFGEPITLKI